MLVDNINRDLILQNTSIYKENDISNIFMDLIRNDSELKDYLYYPSFVNDDEIVSNYSSLSKIICINLEKIKSKACLETKDNNYDIFLYINYSILNVLLHEVTHAKQNYLVNHSPKNPIAKLLMDEMLFIKNNKKLYHQFHNSFAVERDANITSLENILKLTRDIDKNLYDHFMYVLNNVMLNDYILPDSIVPNNIISMRLLNSYPYDVEDNLSTYDKIRYGLNVNKDDVRDIKNNFNDIVEERIFK